MKRTRNSRPSAAPPPSRRPLAVIDLGSNTVRLVVFEGAARVPVPLVNERIFCGLGRGMGSSGLLDEDAIPPLMSCLDRFMHLASSLGAPAPHVLATAAVREASNGAELVRLIRDRFDVAMHVLPGEEEARLTALGTICGLPNADGVVGDLGGGSLELIDVRRHTTGRAVSLPLGPLRLAELAQGSMRAATREIAGQLRQVAWLDRDKGRTLYAVGGSWRALAQIHMNLTDYPLHIVHGYALERKQIAALARFARTLGGKSRRQIDGVPDRRLEMLPLAAMVMSAVVARIRPKKIVFSATGLREGYLFDRLRGAERLKDPLVQAAEALASHEARDPRMAPRLIRWTEGLFAGESASEARLRAVACILSDIGWQDHPSYRAEQVASRVLHAGFLGIDHRERAALAAVLLVRRGGKPRKGGAEGALGLLDRGAMQRAVRLGSALRLAYAVCGGAPDILKDAALRRRGNRLDLTLAGKAAPPGPQVEKAFKGLLRAGGFPEGRILQSG